MPSLAWKVTWSSSGTRDFQPRLAVEVPEVPRIGEAGAQHALVAGDRGGAAVRRLDIGDEAEIRRGRAIGVAEREVALVHPHGDLPHLGRQVHVGIVDAAQQRHRPFHQPRHLVEQAGVVHQLRPAAPSASPAMPSRDDPLAFVGIDHDAALAQLRRPVGAGGHGEGARARGSDGPRSGRPRPARAHRPRRRAGRTAPPRRPAGRRCAAAGGPRRSCWCRPSASTSARGSGAAAAGWRRRSASRPVLPPPSCPAPSSRPPGAAARGSAPCLRRKPARACSGALTRGPRSVVLPAATCGATSAARAMRRGPWKVRTLAGRQRRQRLGAQPRPDRRPRAACMRAGISSLNSSRKSSGIVSPSAPARCRSARSRCP